MLTDDLPSRNNCSCSCHVEPGVMHVAACCDKPSYEEINDTLTT